MAITAWSGRRIATIWIVGAICEAAVLIAPGVLARRYAQRNLPRYERELARIRAEQALVDSRLRLTEQSDSISVAAQRRTAIGAGQYFVDRRGDTVVAVVRTPSGRPDSVAVAVSLGTTWIVGVIALVLWSAIPIVLLVITIRWMLGRKARDVSAAA